MDSTTELRQILERFADRPVYIEAEQAIRAWAVAQAPGEHADTNVPSDRLNAQEDGEVMGWNAAIEAYQAKFKEKTE